MDPEPGEVVFFHGHPSWRSLAGLYGRGLLAAVAAGVIAGIITVIAAGHVQVGWVIAAVALVFLILMLIGQIHRIQTTYSITNQRLTIETGLLSRDLHQTRLERVQNVNATQSLGERILRVGSVSFDTAGEAQFDFAFRGVANPREIVRTVDRALHELRGPEPEAPDGV
ncbi:MAG TPA: PH domain-containing protein [Solirubrobacteraceae bacterium]|nr:PH domain-containing protein [Solirubrobacteraceae bacterium]